MNNHKASHRLISLVVATVILASPLLAQQRRNAPKKPAVAEAAEPAPTFDSLLAADTYKVYCEVRAVGGLVRSPAVNDLLEPMMKLGQPPKEFKTLVKWLNAHAEILAASRMMVAGWPSRPNVPNILVAIEFSSPEEAKKFYPELRDFLPKLYPTPTPTPAPSATQIPDAKPATVIAMNAGETKAPSAELRTPVVYGPDDAQAELRVVPSVATPQTNVTDQQTASSLPPYQMRLAGALVLISDTKLAFKNLRPRGSNPLEEDQNFQLARNRFATESLFLYVDLKSIEDEEKVKQQTWEEETQKRIAAEAANAPKIEEKATARAELIVPEVVEETPPPPSDPDVTVSKETVVEVDPTASSDSGEATLSSGPQAGAEEVSPNFFSLSRILFGGETKWPEAVGAALVFENDAYVIRTLIINNAETKGNPIPFVPQFVSGPAIMPQSPEVFPADTALFVSVSLDYPQIYEGMLKSITSAQSIVTKDGRGAVKEGPPPESPFAFYERKLGLKIKDDLLPLLGNEMALAFPKKLLKPSKEEPKHPTEGSAVESGETSAKPADPNPVVAIAVKDREAVARLLPKVIEALGFKGANLFAQTEKRDGTEIISYGDVFAYAFVGDFLILSPSAAETRHVVDSYLNHQTLSSDGHFRNFTRWQPRQLLGQVYVGPDMMEAYNPFGLRINHPVNDRMSDFLARLSPLIEPTTYALSNDGAGPLHELHIPRNLLQWMIGSSLAGFEEASSRVNEAAGQGLLRNVYSAESAFRATQGNGRYGTLEELLAAKLLTIEAIQQFNYVLHVTATGTRFEATATPNEYGATGTLSYFIDETGVLRGGDHGGGSATAADQPVE
jgi:hypothetical protein